MFKVLKPFIVIVALSMASTTVAEIVLDGTFGSDDMLPGPNFTIETSMGEQKGNNLFHSFSTFNLNSKETATFLGSSNIKNVISRVTGGDISNIDGTLSSKMPNADFYFLNPAGIVFGENAELDVQGSFYVSTADYLRFQDGEKFYVSTSKENSFTIAPPSAFGFLTNTPASISNKDGELELKEGKTLSFIGGDLNFQNGQVKAPDGQINLVSLNSSGEVSIPNYNLEKITELGKITITDKTKGVANKDRKIANIDTSGIGGGKIFLHGGQIILDNGYVFADTQGENDGQGINVKANEKLILKNGGRITTDTLSNGNSGDIYIEAKNISMTEGSQIASTSKSTGMAGDVTIHAEKEIYIAGHFPELIDNKILSSGIFTTAFWTGKGGNVNIFSPILNMKEGVIYTNTIGFKDADAGNVEIEVDTLTLENGTQINVNTGNQDAYVEAGIGRSGNMTITANKNILISNNSSILSNSFTSGNGGKIEIFSPLLEIKDNSTIQAGTKKIGNAGTILINTDMLRLSQNGFITTQSQGSGNAGNIEINTKNLISYDSKINVESENTGGGDIAINTDNLLYLKNSFFTAESKSGQNQDNGGNITLNQADFTILNKSQIFTKGFVGNGGNINITTDSFLSSNSILNASSKSGIDGKIYINASDTDFIGSLKILPTTFVDISNLLRDNCATDKSTFFLGKRTGLSKVFLEQ